LLKYVARRLLIAIPTLWGITVLTYAFINLAPGDPLTSLVLDARGGSAQSISPEALVQLRKEYGLDQPAPVRYMFWLEELARGNMGRRITDRSPVADVIRQRLGPTVELMSAALVISVALGIPLGVISALKQYSRLDYALTVWAFVGVSLPEFFAGIILIYILAVRLNWLPTSGMMTAGAYFSVPDNLAHLAMPAVVLGLAHTSALMRYARSSVLDVLRQEYVTTARAKGLGESVVVIVHIFRNAALPLITVVGLMLPRLIGGAAIVESIFQWPGMGTLYLDAVAQRDYGMIMGLIVMVSAAVLLANLVADLAYAVADPRIRYNR